MYNCSVTCFRSASLRNVQFPLVQVHVVHYDTSVGRILLHLFVCSGFLWICNPKYKWVTVFTRFCVRISIISKQLKLLRQSYFQAQTWSNIYTFESLVLQDQQLITFCKVFVQNFTTQPAFSNLLTFASNYCVVRRVWARGLFYHMLFSYTP